MNCLIINRTYPPTNSITGFSARELAEFLISKGIKVNILHVKSNYSGGPAQILENTNKVNVVRTFYNGKIKPIRFIANIIEGRNLIRKAISLKPDFIIAMTDPPLLNFWTSYYSIKNKLHWAYWAMDLYPNAFNAAGIVSKNNFFYKYFMKTISKGIPNLIIALGQEQENYIKKIYNKNIESVVLPCGIFKNENKIINSIKENYKKISFCYAGNIGEAHDENFLKNFIDNLNPKKHILTLSLYGSKSKSIIEYCNGKNGIKIIEFIKKEDLNSIDIHIVSLKKEWDHICVPSKAISAVCGGSAILFNCSDKNDNWKLLKDAGWRIKPNNDISSQIQKFMENLLTEEIIRKKKNALKIGEKLNSIKIDAFSKIHDFLIQKKYLTNSD